VPANLFLFLSSFWLTGTISEWLNEQYAANGNPKLGDLPDSVLCSHCQINSMRTVQNSVFLGYNAAMISTYQGIFTSRLHS
jgi:hypothetical protein